jgi:hypothetical protein
MDRLDAEILEAEIGSQQGIVAKRISEIIDTLDCAYGTNRKSGDMVGSDDAIVLVHPVKQDSEI